MSDNKQNPMPGDPVNARIVRELLLPLRNSSGSMIGWGIFSIVLGTIGLFAPIAFSVGVTIFVGAMLLVSGATGLAHFLESSGMGARTAAIILALLTAVTGFNLDVLPDFRCRNIDIILGFLLCRRRSC